MTISGPLGSQGGNALVQRACTVIVGFPGSDQGLQIDCGNGTGLDVSFRIQRGQHATTTSTKPQPNTCDLTIYGLNPTHRFQLAKATAKPAGKASAGNGTVAAVVPCIIMAGYQQRKTLFFSGELRAAQDKTSGPNVVTEISSGDGDTAITQARLNVSVAPGATLSQVVNQVLAAFGPAVQPGNLQSALAQFAGSAQASQAFAKGMTLKGSASEIFTDICRSIGAQWSVQNGALQILPLGQPAPGVATVVDENHGMIGTPTVDSKGIAVVETLMLPGIIPGSLIQLTSKNAYGFYRVIGMEVSGDTSPGSTTWGMKLNATRMTTTPSGDQFV
jgi:hypothetical protein